MPRHSLREFLEMLYYYWRSEPARPVEEPFDQEKLARAVEALRNMPAEHEEAKSYLEKHIPRLARTLALVPPPHTTFRVLEIGCYMQITPLLEIEYGYRKVAGGYYGPLGKVVRKKLRFPDRDFYCSVDHFDAERDRFPYPDNYFDLVIATEVIEHLAYDPMHMLLESRRVLCENGKILLGTPNAAGIALVAKALGGVDNPQIYPHYKIPDPEEPDIGHVHEYTCAELEKTVKAAGYEIDRIFTTFIEEYEGHRWLLNFLALNGYPTENRGEQTWCLAKKRSDLPVTRYPSFLYYGA